MKEEARRLMQFALALWVCLSMTLPAGSRPNDPAPEIFHSLPFLFATATAFAAVPEKGEEAVKTLSPYFFVKSEGPEVDQLPLKATSATVTIAGVIADVQVTQVYQNQGKKPLEAIYIFPASTRAAVYAMKMTIGDRTLTAKIEKRQEAREAYEKARKEGKSASLLEQQRPNVFQMNVANILPGDEIKTELSYSELLTPEEGTYEFVYPTVVGPRYSNQPASAAPPTEKWVQNPYLHEGEAPTYSFDIKARLTTGVPVKEVTCTSHTVDVRYEDPSRAVVSLAPGEKSGGNRDFVLKYRLSGEALESGLLLSQGQDENYFLLMMQPPKRVSTESIPPREYIFIVDVSGSMHGFPLETSKRLLQNLIGSLRQTDTFNVLLFSGGSKLMAESSVPATQENIRRALEVIDREQGRGGTELLPALQRALSLPRNERAARTLVIVTDGYVSVETQAFELIRSHIGDANFFPFGIGTSVNRFLLEGMARTGAGEPFVVTNPSEAPVVAERFRRYVQTPLLTRIKLNFDGFGAYEVEPPQVPDVFSERPVVVFGKWKGEPKGTIVLHGTTGNRPYDKSIPVTTTRPETGTSALRQLWARAAVTRLSDYNHLQPNDARVVEITNLGLKYSLLTAYTSFIAVDTQVRRKEGSLETVSQPLPLPRGVSDYAIGGPPMPPGMHARSHPGKAGGASRLLAAESSMGQTTSQPRSGLTEPKMEALSKSNDKEAAVTGARMKIELRSLAVAGTISEEELRPQIEKMLQELVACPPGFLKEDTQEEITVKWIIDARGKADGIKIISNRKDIKSFEQCFIKHMSKWRFKVSGQAHTSVSASLVVSTS